MTHLTASMTLDFPQPLGPTIPTRFPGVGMVVGSTNDLKPASRIFSNLIELLRFQGGLVGVRALSSGLRGDIIAHRRSILGSPSS